MFGVSVPSRVSTRRSALLRFIGKGQQALVTMQASHGLPKALELERIQIVECHRIERLGAEVQEPQIHSPRTLVTRIERYSLGLPSALRERRRARPWDVAQGSGYRSTSMAMTDPFECGTTEIRVLMLGTVLLKIVACIRRGSVVVS